MLKVHFNNKAKWADAYAVLIVEQMRYRPTNQPTNQPTDQLMDTASYRHALAHVGIPTKSTIIQVPTFFSFYVTICRSIHSMLCLTLGPLISNRRLLDFGYSIADYFSLSMKRQRPMFMLYLFWHF